MAPLILEGHTLGEKHRHYNALMKDAVEKSKGGRIEKICYEDSDVSNLCKIDVASYNRDTQYILEVLKCEDMLYAFRAIKQSKWLITDLRYADIINPEYLYNELFPQMTVKAKNKFLLQIRLCLKNEKQVESFFSYIKLHDLRLALKWLPNCSIPFIEEIVCDHANDISVSLMKRLCEKSETILDIYCKKNTNYNRSNVLLKTIFLLRKDVERYLNIVETYRSSETPRFGPKATKLIMKKYPNRIFDNLERYAHYIDIPTFTKYMKEEEIQAFILKNKQNEKLNYFFNHDNIRHFLQRLSQETRFNFVKQIFMDKTHASEGNIAPVPLSDHMFKCGASMSVPTSSNVYTWYKFAPFNVAMTDLKKLIRTESNPNERIAILVILLHCARNNAQNVQSLIQFYRENHINEPFKFKIQFVNNLINKTNTYKYDTKTWALLNDLFISMEVFEESNNNVQACLKSIILYNVLNDGEIPAVVENKFEFDTFKVFEKKLNNHEKEKLFKYLYLYLTTKLNKCETKHERGFAMAVSVLEKCLRLLIDWNKNLTDYPLFIEKIKEFIQIKYHNSWNEELSQLYNLKKSWKKILFKESILLCPTPSTCINAIKHDPNLLHIHKEKIDHIFLSDAGGLISLLKKVRIYWDQTLSNQLKIFYFNKIDQKVYHKAAILGLCILLPKNQLSELIYKYAPSSNKIVWDQIDETDLSITKNIAKRLCLARPQPSLTAALLYAKGDYFQYVLPSVLAILYNMKSIKARENLEYLLNAPVSLQKHGIRSTLATLKNKEIKEIFEKLWNSTKNSSIRAEIFKQTFELLCREKNQSAAEEIWELLSLFIDNLTAEENKIIYYTLSNSPKVPLPIKVHYWIKSYKFMKNLPEKANCAKLFHNLKSKIIEVIEFLDVELVKDIIFETFDNENKNKYKETTYLVVYLYYSRDEITQNHRYEKILLPILEKAFDSWNKEINNQYRTRKQINQIIKTFYRELNECVLNKNMVIPIAMLTNILKKFEDSLHKEENYVLLTTLKLTLSYIKILDTVIKYEKQNTNEDFLKTYGCKWNLLYAKTIPEFANVCLEYFKQDVNSYFPTTYMLFSDALSTVFDNFCDSEIDNLKTLDVFLEDKDFIQGHLLVLKSLPEYLYLDEDKKLRNDILAKIHTHPSSQVNMHYWGYIEKHEL